jgi:autotransporter-associated beta strand protein
MIKNKSGCNCYTAVRLGILIAAFAWFPQANAQMTTWNNNGGDYEWGNVNNWSNGIPTATSSALFDGLGVESAINIGTQTTLIQFGQATETSGDSIASYILGTGTLNFNSNTAPVSYYGSANTADQTINANIILGTDGTGAAVRTFYINNLSGGGRLIFAGDIKTAFPTDQTMIWLGGIVNNAGNYGDMVLRGNTMGAGNVTSMNVRFQINGDTGALVFDNATGINLSGQNGYSIFINRSRSSQDAPHVEFASGNNIIQANAIDIIAGTPAVVGNYYVKVDTGASVVLGNVIKGNVTTAVQTLNLYGGGNGVVFGGLLGNGNVDVNLALVKDGDGTWAFTGNVAANTYKGDTSIRNGIFLAMGNGSTGTGTVLVDPTNSADVNAAPILGGRGTITGAVTVKDGGSIAPGGTAAGGATTLAVVSSPLDNVGTLTLNSSLTAESGAIFAFDLDSDGYFDGNLGTSDQLLVAGDLNLNSATLSLTDIGSATLSADEYFALINYSANLTGIFDGLGQDALVTVGANQYAIDYGILHANQITLNLIPEPSAWALLLGGAGLLFMLRFFRRQRNSGKV